MRLFIQYISVAILVFIVAAFFLGYLHGDF